jgi:thioredoxin reductase (NADPH)
MKERVSNKENIEILYETNTLGLFGDDGVQGAHLVYRKGEADEKEYDLPIDGFFLAIGHNPNTEIFKGAIDMDEKGFIITQGNSPKTNIEGVFAAGDCADPIYRQGIVAAGSGAKAAIEADRYLQTKG